MPIPETMLRDWKYIYRWGLGIREGKHKLVKVVRSLWAKTGKDLSIKKDGGF